MDIPNHDSLDTTISSLGEAKIPSPLNRRLQNCDDDQYVSDNDRILIDVDLNTIARKFQAGEKVSGLELAGPRNRIYFDPSKLRCALVTCGGLCPGLNGIIRSIVLQLYHGYGVHNIYGIRYGL
ncbi:MAG: hypothetical protein PHD57_00685 [Desulfobacterales bacterium]|nr:hypothetical protein [Desulfobacterales bacterium]